MAQTVPATTIQANIQGDIHGQVAIGNNILQIGSIYGGIVNIAMPGQIALPRARPSPVFLRPRPFPGLLDRRTETGAALAALASAEPVEFHAEAGMGKTALLRHLANTPPAAAFPDGIVHLPARGQPAADLLQALFDTFYESDKSIRLKPDDAQIRHALQDRRALVVFDDVDLPREELQALMDAAPACTFLMASEERRLWGEGRSLALRGLPIEDAITLFERELGRPLSAEERPNAGSLCHALQGHPLRILQAAALVREKGRSLLEVMPVARSAQPAAALTSHLVVTLSEAERRAMEVLAVLDGASLHSEHLSNVSGLAGNAPAILEGLQRRGLVQAHGQRYRSTGTLGQALRQSPEASRWAERTLAYLTNWVERRRRSPGRIAEETEAILQMLKWAVTAGHWKEALRLARAVEGTFALNGRWGAWALALQTGLESARALNDLPAEAWMLHQSGTRALCLGEAAIARTSLIRALRLRETLEDYRGADVTRHNLNILLGPPTPPQEPPRQPPSSPVPAAPGMPLFVKVLAGVLLLALGGVGAAWAISLQPTPVPATATPIVATQTFTHTPAPTSTVTPTSTATPAPTDTPTATNTATATPTPCVPRGDWPTDIVRPGDTLSSIARRTGSSANELRLANCLAGDVIYVGQQLRVPRLPTPTATPTPTTIPGIGFKPEGLNFDNQRVGTGSYPQILYLISAGTGILTIDNVTLAGSHPGDFAILADNCTATSLAPGSTCSISLSFAPKAAGERSAILVINDNAAGSPHSVPLTGIGVGVPLARLEPTRLDFGSQLVNSRSDTQYVTLSSVGSADLVVGDVTVKDASVRQGARSGFAGLSAGAIPGGQARPAIQGYPGDFFKFRDDCSNRILAPGSSCVIGIIFTPRVEGIRSGVLTVNDNAIDSPHNASLVGMGAGKPLPTPTPTSPPIG